MTSRRLRSALLPLLATGFLGLAAATTASGDPIFQGVPIDFLIPVDLDGNGDATRYPSSGCGETAKCLIDQTLAKHTNIGNTNSGFIATPAVGATIVDSFQLTTANDVVGRDPTSFLLHGTNDPITSGFGSRGTNENWTLIASGTLSLTNDRNTLQAVVAVANTTPYRSYRMVYPTLKGNQQFMQLAEVQFFGTVVADADGDGVPDDVDNCPATPNSSQDDVDGDGAGDACDGCAFDPDNDVDGDGVCGDADNCPAVPNSDQADSDGDGIGDACDLFPDADADGVADPDDNCLAAFNPGQEDSDGDGAGDACDACALDPENDADGDGICGDADNCPDAANPSQADADGDGIGDVCDPDGDNDGVDDGVDNCPFDANADQADADGDGAGDVCDADSDGDGVIDASDACLGTPLGEPVLADGCSIAQTCPCESPWKNHGAYMRCTAAAADTLVGAGILSEAEKNAVLGEAGPTDCGQRP